MIVGLVNSILELSLGRVWLGIAIVHVCSLIVDGLLACLAHMEGDTCVGEIQNFLPYTFDSYVVRAPNNIPERVNT